MATTTPNFGWSVPTSTDLVKDGATAIETLGDSIDASLLDLKGGTSGQVLAKNSGTDMDFVWVTTDDANAIQNAIVDAKGDLIGATAADTPARLAVGANGTVLTADSAQATGLKWATPASTSGFTYINSYSFSNVASLSMSSIFSATYDYYRIVVDFNLTSAGDFLNLRLRTGATDNTSSSYYSSIVKNESSTVTGSYDNGATGFTRMVLCGQNSSIVSFDITNPFSSSLPTYINGVWGAFKSSATARYATGTGAGWFDGNTSFDGMTLIPPVNFTGKAKVYGYSNS